MGTKRKISRLKDEYFLELQRNGEDIVDKYRDIIRQYTGFDLNFNFYYINTNDYGCSFYLTSDDYPRTELYLNSVACSSYRYYNKGGIKDAQGEFVDCIIPGRRLGEIVFNLQLLLSIISGVKEVIISNFADDPERAMKGIYKLFDIDERDNPRKKFKGKSMAEKLNISNGCIRFILTSDSEERWEKNWEEIINKLKIKTELKGQAFRIYGVGEAEEPNIKVINSPSNEYDGLYEYKTRGSSGDIYVNEEKNKLIKINTATAYTSQEQEVEKQLSVKELAPKIYWHGYYTIYMEDTDNIFQYSTNPPYENIGVIIMEYLNSDEWMPINDIIIDDKQIQTLLDALYKLVVTYKLTNLKDIIGYSGPHTFIKKNEPYEVKFIDYDKFESFKGNNKTNFLKICNELSLAVRPRMRFLFKFHEYVLSRWPHTRSVRNRKSSIKSSRKTKFRLDNLETKASIKSKKSKKKKHTKRKNKRKKE